MNVTVWAPAAKTVELVTPSKRIALRPAAGQDSASGGWQAEIEDSVPEEGYRFSIDGGEPMPDPRSKWQPDGVHGRSRPVEAAGLREAHARNAPRFAPRPLRDAVIYELHVGSFTPEGTYAGAQQKLPHLVRLGVTHLELMPVAAFPGRRGWGYDGVDLYAPFSAYGSPRELAYSGRTRFPAWARRACSLTFGRM